MIVFEKIRYKNFLSTGNKFIEMDLNTKKTTLQIGKNGSGKSSVLDALCFVLFGKPFRKINKPQLVNSINNKECLVEIEFSIGTDAYIIRRGIKPNVFDIIQNGNKLNKNADAMDYQKYLENSILKLNFKSFTQIVILGSSSFVPFMQLTAADRRVIVEDILDIAIFSSINNVLKNSATNLKEEIKQYDTLVEVKRGKIEIQEEHIEKIKASNESNKTNRNRDIESTKQEIIGHTQEVEKCQKEIENLHASILDKDSIRSEIKRYESIKIQGDEKKIPIMESLQFYEHNSDCPECKQAIDVDFKNKIVDKKLSDLKFIDDKLNDVSQKQNDAQNRLIVIDEVLGKIRDISTEIQKHSTQIVALNRYLDNIKSSETEVDLHKEISDLSKMKMEYDELIETKCSLLKSQKLHDVAAVLLKDTGIKSKIIKQYLPTINAMINKYLADLNFYVSFHLDENFNEEIKSRNKESFSYGSFSEGQKMRIDLALLFTWREVAKMKNSVNTNLLFLDEIFDSSMDAAGTDEIMKLINAVSGASNIFLISHKTDQFFDKFDSVIQFEIKNNFTSMKYV